ncbi:type IV-A pilus assembly ATPase PilB [Desulfoplanes sp.]
MQSNIIQALTEWAQLSQEQVNTVEGLRKKRRLNFLQAAYKSGVINDAQYVEFLAQRLGIPAVAPVHMVVPETVIGLVPRDLLEKYSAAPFHIKGKKLYLAMSEPDDILAVDDIRFMTGLDPIVHVASPAAISKCIGRLKEDDEPEDFGDIQDALSDMEGEGMEFESGDGEETDDTSTLEAATQAPVVKMVNLIIMDAIKKKASDIHIEPYEKNFRVRLRIDGILHEVMRPPIRLKNAIISRLKIMAHLNIAEKRIPQDGRIKVRTPGGKEMEFRVSMLPTLFGEKVVMRLLDKSALKVDLSQLGFEEGSLTTLSKAVHMPYGMVLVTGPTGSGKTTTLYSVISELNDDGVNISTAEDPVEFSLPGVNQVLVKEDVGLSFAAALRSFLRQDPDIILVGEIRDLETAEIAIKAALTGHLVLSTLHTNDAPSTLTRLLNMGVDGFLVASSVNVIVAQRLVRKLCPFCRRKVDPDREKLAQLGMSPEEIDGATIYEPAGCTECNESGYKGRLGVYEVLEMTAEMQELVLEGKSVLEIRELAMEQGMMTLRESALQKLQTGVTSVQEVMRVTV